MGVAYIWDATIFPICYLGGEDRLFSKNTRAAKATFNGQGGGWKVAGKNCRVELLDFGHSRTFPQLKFLDVLSAIAISSETSQNISQTDIF